MDPEEQWRYIRFMAMGCETEQAERLAQTDIDIGRARRMCQDGCSPDLMEQILVDTTVWDEIDYRESVRTEKPNARKGKPAS